MKKRNVIADAMRGAAGLCILLFHISEPYGWGGRVGNPGIVPQICGHGYLCVEFFLLLMGFMLARAYDRRWTEGMTIGQFCKRRLVRLHPLVVSGMLLGFFLYLTQLAGWTTFDAKMATMGFGQVVGLACLCLVMYPCFSTSLLSPFNPCSWTLYYEYVANLLYGLFVRRFNKLTLLVLSLVAGFWTVTFVMHVDLNALFGLHNSLLADVAARTRDSIEIGWGVRPVDFYGGFVRLCFPFFFGLLLSRLGWKIRIPKFGLPICLAVFLAILFMPMPFGSMYQNGAYELLVLFVLLPLLLLASEGTEVKSEKQAKFWAALAEFSYPLYMSHYPFMRLYNDWVRLHSHQYSAMTCVLIGVVLYMLIVGYAYLVMRFWDEKVRAFFTRRR